jgi:hypothetical protein
LRPGERRTVFWGGEDAGNLVPDAVLGHFAGADQMPRKFRERSRALLFNARWARQAIELAGRLGL